jgi:hypothetical protein
VITSIFVSWISEHFWVIPISSFCPPGAQALIVSPLGAFLSDTQTRIYSHGMLHLEMGMHGYLNDDVFWV